MTEERGSERDRERLRDLARQEQGATRERQGTEIYCTEVDLKAKTRAAALEEEEGGEELPKLEHTREKPWKKGRGGRKREVLTGGREATPAADLG